MSVCMAGKLFHTRAPATAKARSPRVRRRVVGTSRVDDEPERSLDRDSTSAARLKVYHYIRRYLSSLLLKQFSALADTT